MHMYNFLCSDSLLYFFLFLSTLHSVYTRDCSCTVLFFIYPAINSKVCIMLCMWHGVNEHSDNTLIVALC